MGLADANDNIDAAKIMFDNMMIFSGEVRRLMNLEMTLPAADYNLVLDKT